MPETVIEGAGAPEGTPPEGTPPAATVITGDEKNTPSPEEAAAAKVAEEAEAKAKAGAAEKEGKEGKPSDDKPKDGDADDGKDVGAPEAYEEFTLPDSITVIPEAMEKFQGIAKTLDLTQGQAQELVDFQTQFMLDNATQSQKNWEAQMDIWVDTANNDEEIGGEKFEENVAIAKTAIDKFGTPELKKQLDATGTGNHVEFLRFFLNVGKAIAEDGISLGKGGKDAPVTQAERLFGKNE